MKALNVFMLIQVHPLLQILTEHHSEGILFSLLISEVLVISPIGHRIVQHDLQGL